MLLVQTEINQWIMSSYTHFICTQWCVKDTQVQIYRVWKSFAVYVKDSRADSGGAPSDVSLPNIHDWSKHDQAPHWSWQWPTCGDHLYLLCMFQPPCLLHLSSWVPCTHALYTHIDIVFKVSVATLLQGTIIIQLSRHPSKQSTLRLWNEQHTYSMLLVFGMLTGMAARLNDNSV